ncbi:hypothetical protein KC351_g58 [Hortaea werneckii]|nr:hypothetical protein KC351_g58 [Hortaea werneckii]
MADTWAFGMDFANRCRWAQIDEAPSKSGSERRTGETWSFGSCEDAKRNAGNSAGKIGVVRNVSCNRPQTCQASAASNDRVRAFPWRAIRSLHMIDVFKVVRDDEGDNNA